MQPEIKRPKREFDTAERCFISEVANDAGDEQVSISRARVVPGGTTEWHFLIDTNERFIIVQGTGLMEMRGTEPAVVSVGDVVRIPANVPQRITNTGDADLIFYCVCSPPFRSEAYRSGESGSE